MKSDYMMRKREFLDKSEKEEYQYYMGEDLVLKSRGRGGLDGGVCPSKLTRTRGIIYLLDVVVILGMLLYWNGFGDKKISAMEWIYDFELKDGGIGGIGRKEVVVYLKNNTSESKRLKKKYTIDLLIDGEGQGRKEFWIDEDLRGGEVMRLGVFDFDTEVRKKIGIIIDEEFIISKGVDGQDGNDGNDGNDG